MTKSVLLTIFALLLSACANPLNLKTASMYAQGCHDFQGKNEWWKARNACGRAIVNAKLGGASARAIAALWYEYGRTSGAICDYVEAKRGLEEALKLDQATGGPVYMSLLEMARLNVAQGEFSEAAANFSRFWSALPKDIAQQKDPIGVAEVLEEQAETSKQIGELSLAKAANEQAAALRAANPTKTSNTDHTPYGKFCGQKS